MSIHVTIGELFADMFDAEPELRPTCVADRRGVRAEWRAGRSTSFACRVVADPRGGAVLMSGHREMEEIVTDTQEHADQVMADRLGFDDPYIDANGQAFDYLVDWITA